MSISGPTDGRIAVGHSELDCQHARCREARASLQRRLHRSYKLSWKEESEYKTVGDSCEKLRNEVGELQATNADLQSELAETRAQLSFFEDTNSTEQELRAQLLASQEKQQKLSEQLALEQQKSAA